MSLEMLPFVLGPLDNNTYLLVDQETGSAVIIDPAFDCGEVVDIIRRKGWQLAAIWITHAHFDHIAGVPEVLAAWGKPVPVALHPADLPLWRSNGGADAFGFMLNPGPEPAFLVEDGQFLDLGESRVEVRLVPGHSQGHVMYYAAQIAALFCGDVIFRGSIGRTDLEGGNFDLLIEGIRAKVLTLPDNTRLFPGHGPDTTVEMEKKYNPFLS